MNEEEYTLTIKVKDGIVADEINGATINNVHTIGINTVEYMIDCLDANGELLGFFCYARNKNSYIHCDYDDWEKDICLAINGKISEEILSIITEGDDNMSNEKRIEEIKRIIKDFADADQYSVNNEYVKALYRELRELEGREQIKEENYEPIFIGESDVPIGGYYE